MTDYQYNPLIEQWKAIPDFPGYEVSDHGKVRSLKRKNHFMKPGIRSEREYIHLRNHKEHRIATYRLVLLAFVGPCPIGMEACHRDGNKYNNKLDNLRWGTRFENRMDDLDNKRARSNLTRDIVKQIRYFTDKGFKRRDIAKHFNVSLTTVTYIYQRRIWKHII